MQSSPNEKTPGKTGAAVSCPMGAGQLAEGKGSTFIVTEKTSADNKSFSEQLQATDNLIRFLQNLSDIELKLLNREVVRSVAAGAKDYGGKPVSYLYYELYEEETRREKATKEAGTPNIAEVIENYRSRLAAYEQDSFFSVLNIDHPEVFEIVKPCLNREKKPPFKTRPTVENLIKIIELDPAVSKIARLDASTGKITYAEKYKSIDHLAVELCKYLIFYELDLNVEKALFVIKTVAHRPGNIYYSIWEAYKALGEAPANNPLKKILTFITWGTHETTSAAHEVFDLFLKKLSLQQIIPIKAPGKTFPCDIAMGYYGSQGTGKTTLVRRLSLSQKLFIEAGDKSQDYFSTKDGYSEMVGKDIAELGEFKGFRATEKIKALISKEKFDFRRPYAHDEISLPRTIGFIFTVNGSKFLNDATGNRRFFPLEVKSIDFSLFHTHGALFQKLRAWYRDWAVSFIEDNKKDLDTALYGIRESSALSQFLSSAREDVRDISITEDLVLEYFEKVSTAHESGNWESFRHTRPLLWQRELYFTQMEAATMIYPSGRVPGDFSKVFSETAEREGLVYGNTRIAGHRLRHWRLPGTTPEHWNTGTPPFYLKGRDKESSSSTYHVQNVPVPVFQCSESNETDPFQ